MNKYCIKGKQAKMLCSSNCKKYAPVCEDEECACIKEHEFCSLISLKNLNKGIIKNMRDAKPII